MAGPNPSRQEGILEPLWPPRRAPEGNLKAGVARPQRVLEGFHHRVEVRLEREQRTGVLGGVGAPA